MVGLIKKVLDKEFKANEIDIQAKVNEYAWQNNKPVNYQIDLLYASTRKVMRILMDANYPYTTKIMPYNHIEPHKMIRLCEVIIEAFEELKRQSGSDGKS